jgi:hypothetical protein
MGWATIHVGRLAKGETVSFRPHGNSMTPLIESGQLCQVSPCEIAAVEVGDVVLCKVNGREFLHKVTAKRNGQVQISNNHGHVNGWTTRVYGKLTKVSP